MSKYQVTVSNGHCTIDNFKANTLAEIKKDIKESNGKEHLYNIRHAGETKYIKPFDKLTIEKC